MNHMRRLGLIAIGTVLVLSACDPGDLDIALDDFGAPLSESPERSVQAAGDTVIEVLATQEAEDHLDQALETNDLDEAQQAVALRPDDPRYRVHEAVIRNANNSGAEDGALGAAIILIQVSSPRWAECGGAPLLMITQEECIRWFKDSQRQTTEMYLNATREAILRTDDEEQRKRLVDTYCKGITQKYPDQYSVDFPAETTAYEATEADRTQCTKWVPTPEDE